jgi:hypothetical protein
MPGMSHKTTKPARWGLYEWVTVLLATLAVLLVAAQLALSVMAALR